MKPVSNSLTLMGVFTAMIVVVGYAFIHVPNVEVLLATTFLAGMILGPKKGAFVGGVGELIYAVLNPLGISAVPLLLGQVIGVAVVGFSGGLVIRADYRNITVKKQIFLLALCGFGLTLFFDLLTTLSFLIMSGLTIHTFLGAYAYGAPFYIIHVVANTAIFSLLIPLLYRVLMKTNFILN